MKSALLLMLLVASAAAAEPAPIKNKRIAAIKSARDENQPGPYTETVTFEKPLAATKLTCTVSLRDDDPAGDRRADDAQHIQVTVTADGHEVVGTTDPKDNQIVFRLGAPVRHLGITVNAPAKRRTGLTWFIEGEGEYYDLWWHQSQAGLDAIDALTQDIYQRACDLAWLAQVGQFPVTESTNHDDANQMPIGPPTVVGSWATAAVLLHDCQRVTGGRKSGQPFIDGPNKLLFTFDSCGEDIFAWTFAWDAKRWKLTEIRNLLRHMCG